MNKWVIAALVFVLGIPQLSAQISDAELERRKKEKMMMTLPEAMRLGGGLPEQDCNGALAVCQDTYVQPDAYSGVGSIQEIPGSSCLGSQERNSVWYIFTVQAAGTLSFTIDPNVNSDDYDFALYDITNRNCSDIITGAAPEVRCNYCVDPGNTGISSDGINPSEPCCDYDGCQFSTALDVSVGETYVLNVSNFTSSNDGYTLTFSGDAEIFDNSPPEPSSIVTPCGADFIEVQLTEPIVCSSITADGSEFTLTGPGGPFTISGATGVNCGTSTSQLTLDVSPPVIIGSDYVLTIITGGDANTIIDNCENATPQGTTYEFTAVPTETSIDGPTEACVGTPVTLTAGPGESWEWSNGETTQSITVEPTESTTYSVTVTSPNCDQSASITVDVTPAPVANFSFDPPTPCAGQNVVFTNTTTRLTSCLGLGIDPCETDGDCTPFPCLPNLTSYSYDFGDGGTSISSDPFYTFDDPGTYEITLTATDLFNGCDNQITIPVTVLPDGGSLSLPPDESICEGESTTITASGGGSYNWTSNPPGFTSTDATITVSPTVTTTYSVTAPGCSGDLNGSVTVTVNEIPEVEASSDIPTICPGLSATLTASGASTYTWSPAGGLSGTTGSTVTASPDVTTTYTVTGVNAEGCENTATVEVVVEGALDPEIIPDGPVQYCGDEVIDINLDAGSGFNSYSWNSGGSGQTINVTSPGEYIVTVTDDNGCTGSDTITISVVDELEVATNGDQSICAGESVSLTASGGSTYTWSPSFGLDNTSGATVNANPDQTTTYTVMAVDGNCDGMANVTVEVNPIPDLTLDPASASIESGESVQISTTSDGTSFNWTPDDGSLDDATSGEPVASPTETTTYTVTTTDANGCENTASITVTVTEDELCSLTTLYVPNAFSPNADGQNDILFVRLMEDYDRLDFRIYNRWGELVFETNDINNGWDGTYEGEKQTTGAFAYYLEIQCGPEIKQQRGNITIVR